MAQRRSRVCLPRAKWPAAECTGRTGWRAIRSWKGWCSVHVLLRRLWPSPVGTVCRCSSYEAAIRPGQFGTLEDAEKLRSSLRRTMWGQVGIIRSGESLIRACAQLSRWAQVVSQPFANRAALEVKNMVQLAQCVAEAALWRENSVGAHYRSDFPQAKRAGWQEHSRVSMVDGVSGQKVRKARGLVLALRGRAG